MLFAVVQSKLIYKNRLIEKNDCIALQISAQELKRKTTTMM